MKANYDKKCWSCGSTDLEPQGSYVRCRACGATYNPLPGTGHPAVIITNDPLSPGFSPKKETFFTPSPAVRRRAEKARKSVSDPRD